MSGIQSCIPEDLQDLSGFLQGQHAVPILIG
jgi:hypothetical protein